VLGTLAGLILVGGYLGETKNYRGLFLSGMWFMPVISSQVLIKG
jgi:hypothetical protein